MKKFCGIMRCIIGALGAFFMIMVGRNKVFWVPSYGFFLTDKAQVYSFFVQVFWYGYNFSEIQRGVCGWEHF